MSRHSDRRQPMPGVEYWDKQSDADDLRKIGDALSSGDFSDSDREEVVAAIHRIADRRDPEVSLIGDGNSFEVPEDSDYVYDADCRGSPIGKAGQTDEERSTGLLGRLKGLF